MKGDGIVKKTHTNSCRFGVCAAVLLAAGGVFLGNPDKTLAAQGLEMSTDYPGVSVNAGDSLDFGLDFSSTEEGGCDAALSVASLPDGWDGYFVGSDTQISRVHVEGNSGNSETDLATFRLTVPEDAAEGTYTVELTADGGGANTDSLELEITVAEVEAGQSSFTAEYKEQQGASGSSFTFDTTLTNNRSTEQSYSLTADAPSGWQVGFTPSGESSQVANTTLEGRTEQSITVDVTPPENVEQGEYTIPCTASSAEETLSMDLVVTITGSYSLEVTTGSGNLSLDAYANTEKSVTLQIKNTGNVDLKNLELSSSAPTDWEVTFEESTIELLEAGETAEVVANITPSEDAITGDYMTTITASNDETTAEAEFRISVKTRTAWGIFAVAIIVVLICGVGFVFRKYGRR